MQIMMSALRVVSSATALGAVVLVAMVVFKMETPGHLQWKWTHTSSVVPITSCVTSIYTCCHGSVGRTQGWQKVLAWANLLAQHMAQAFT